MGDQESPIQTQPLVDLVKVQAGAVVSRTLLKKQAGNVTLFGFDTGQGLSEHTTPHDALVMCIEGDLEISIAGAPHRVTDGQVLLMPAGQPHALQAAAQTKMLLVMIHE